MYQNKEPAPLKWWNRNYREVDFLSPEKELNSEILTLLGKEWMIFSENTLFKNWEEWS